MTHTPGPWTVEVETREPRHVILMGDKELRISGLSEADARLIAAAPRLLDFARKYISEVHMTHAQNSKTGRDHNQLCNLAFDIIAEAEGES